MERNSIDVLSANKPPTVEKVQVYRNGSVEGIGARWNAQVAEIHDLEKSLNLPLSEGLRNIRQLVERKSFLHGVAAARDGSVASTSPASASSETAAAAIPARLPGVAKAAVQSFVAAPAASTASSLARAEAATKAIFGDAQLRGLMSNNGSHTSEADLNRLKAAQDEHEDAERRYGLNSPATYRAFDRVHEIQQEIRKGWSGSDHDKLCRICAHFASAGLELPVPAPTGFIRHRATQPLRGHALEDAKAALQTFNTLVDVPVAALNAGINPISKAAIGLHIDSGKMTNNRGILEIITSG